MAHLITNLENIYTTYFQPPYKVNDNRKALILPEYERLTPKDRANITIKGIPLIEYYKGREVFLPVHLWMSNQDYLAIYCCTIRVTSKKTIIRTAVSERVGTIKEQFSVGDYIFTIKGVLIGEDGTFPDDKILKLKELYEATVAVELHNAYTELFMTASRRIAIESIEFPEVQGGSKHHKPFVLTCESDFVDSLIVPA
ncbi:MAG: DUF6046 domain-containing protein [Dysgonomonas sp.]|uniref:DUF6046 domain-containing protein n=1 Tax=Dysgonomonas sp. TaxID=1891233 RepID=UPI003A8BBB23